MFSPVHHISLVSMSLKAELPNWHTRQKVQRANIYNSCITIFFIINPGHLWEHCRELVPFTEVNIDLFHFKEGFSPKAESVKLKRELWELARARCDRSLSQSRPKPGRSRARIQWPWKEHYVLWPKGKRCGKKRTRIGGSLTRSPTEEFRSQC